MTSTPEVTTHLTDDELDRITAGDGPSTGSRLNWLRAGVLGANDGIVAVSGLVIGVAASGAEHGALVTAGLAGLASGALSMAVGEYVSVSTQRDTEKAVIETELALLENHPHLELEQLAGLYEEKGVEKDLARRVAEQLTAHDALGAHAQAHLGVDHEEFTNPWHAAFASMGAFVLGAMIPLLTMLLLPAAVRVPATIVAAAIALALTGLISAKLGGAKAARAVLRNVLGGLLAMAVTYLIGHAVGANIA